MKLKRFCIDINSVILFLFFLFGVIICNYIFYLYSKNNYTEDFSLLNNDLYKLILNNKESNNKDNLAQNNILTQDNLNILYNNKFNSQCCNNKKNDYVSSTGCSCLSNKQIKYFNTRGGNNMIGENPLPPIM